MKNKILITVLLIASVCLVAVGSLWSSSAKAKADSLEAKADRLRNSNQGKEEEIARMQNTEVDNSVDERFFNDRSVFYDSLFSLLNNESNHATMNTDALQTLNSGIIYTAKTGSLMDLRFMIVNRADDGVYRYAAIFTIKMANEDSVYCAFFSTDANGRFYDMEVYQTNITSIG